MAFPFRFSAYPSRFCSLKRPREQLSQQLTSIKCTTLAPTKCSCSLELLTVVPSTKAGVINLAVGPARRQIHSGAILVLLFYSYTTIQLARVLHPRYRKISNPQFLVLQYLGISQNP
ncbi:hypothetical protein N7501_005661 [Penicillium viridicatum]|nr:hypothetical protein N7501_005661 [Penicillium viridicatum]